MSLSYFRTPKMLIAAGLIVAGGAFIVACGVGQTPTAATSVTREVVTAGGGSVSALAENTLGICHPNDSNVYVPLQINPSAEVGHRKHGDARPYEGVPGFPGYTFKDRCIKNAISRAKNKAGRNDRCMPGGSFDSAGLTRGLL
jgi:hypothetical protein